MNVRGFLRAYDPVLPELALCLAAAYLALLALQQGGAAGQSRAERSASVAGAENVRSASSLNSSGALGTTAAGKPAPEAAAGRDARQASPLVLPTSGDLHITVSGAGQGLCRIGETPVSDVAALQAVLAQWRARGGKSVVVHSDRPALEQPGLQAVLECLYSARIPFELAAGK